MIPKEDIDKIFETARVEEVVGDFVTLKKRGANMIGLCPFHDEKTPSFYVSPAKNIYKCFGCGKGGNSINFVMDVESMTYPDALRSLAKKYNIELEEVEQSPEQIQMQSARESIYVALSYAQKLFSENLNNTDEGKSIGLSYFKERGYNEDTINKFQLGYSLNNRTIFSEKAIAAGHKLEFLIKAGLTNNYAEEGATKQKLSDRFFSRVIFPIHNVSGRVIAFGGRTLRNDKKIAKYVNSPETDVYHKSDVLYGIYFAKKDIINKDNCFLVEGYTDVVSLHQAGIENVVASSGTSLTPGQIKLIRRYTSNITILYDGDSAGIKASFRGIDLILQEGLNVKVLLFPDGEDPDSYSKKVNKEELTSFIEDNSQDFISFKTSLLMKDAKNDPIKKAGLIKDIVESIALIPEAIHRSVYVKECSSLLDIEESILLTELNKIRNKKFHDNNKKVSTSPSFGSEEPPPEFYAEQYAEENPQDNGHNPNADEQEKKIIEFLIKHGDQIIMVDSDEKDSRDNVIKIETTVANLIVAELSAADDNFKFDKELYNTIYKEFVDSVEGNTTLPVEKDFLNHANPEICLLTVDLVSSKYSLCNWEKHGIYINYEHDDLKKSAEKYVYTLVSRRLELMIFDVDKQMKEAKGDDEVISLLEIRHQLNQSKVSINSYLGRIIVK